MSTIDDSSTDEEVWAAYDANASYEEDGSVAKCKAFITACRILIRRLPVSTTIPTKSITLNVQGLGRQLDEARAWRREHDTSAPSSNLDGRVIHPDFSNFRY